MVGPPRINLILLLLLVGIVIGLPPHGSGLDGGLVVTLANFRRSRSGRGNPAMAHLLPPRELLTFRGGGKESEPSSEADEDLAPDWDRLGELARRAFELKTARLGPGFAFDSSSSDNDDLLSPAALEQVAPVDGGTRQPRAEAPSAEEVAAEQAFRDEVDKAAGIPAIGRGGYTQEPRKRTYGMAPQEFRSTSRMDGPLFAFGDGLSLGIGPLPEASQDDDGIEGYVGGPNDQYRPTSSEGLDGLRVAHVASGLQHTVVVTDDGTVMSCGWNENGQLGLGHCEMLPGSCFFGPVMDVIPRLPVTKLVCGDLHTVIVLNDGSAWGWGSDSYGQIGLGGLSEAQATPSRISFGPAAWPSVEVMDVAAGGVHTVFLLKTGQVFACGDNQSGQLGLGFYAEMGYVPDPVPLVTRLLEVIRHKRVPEAIKRSGTFQSLNPTAVPTEVVELRKYKRKVEQVACGADTSFFVLEPAPGDGDAPVLLACGANDFSQLGLGKCQTDKCLPVPIPLPQGSAVRLLASGAEHVICLLEDGVALGWGRNDVGQLGIGDAEEQLDEPRRLGAGWHGAGHVSQLACGRSHTVVLLSGQRRGGLAGGDVLVCGRNDRGQLGVGAPAERDLVFVGGGGPGEGDLDERVFGEHRPVVALRKVEQLCGRVRSVACGAYNTFAVPM